MAGDGGPLFAPNTEIREPLELLPIQLEGRWGYADRGGRVVVPPIYVWVDYFYREFDMTYMDSGDDKMTRRLAWRSRYIAEGDLTKWLRMQTNQSKKGSPTAMSITTGGYGYHSVDRFMSDGYRGHLRQGGMDGRFGVSYLDSKNNTGAIYDGLLRVSDNLIAFEQAGFCGFLRADAEVALPARFAAVRSFVDGFAAAQATKADGGGWGYIDKRGEFVFKDRRGEIEDVKSFSDGMAAIQVRGKWGFIDRSFRPRVKPKYDDVRGYHDGLAAVSRDGVWGYITKTGKKVVWDLEEAHDFPDPARLEPEARLDDKPVSLALAKKDGLYGYLDKRGKWRIEPQYKSAMPFFRGVARVGLGPPSFGYIDTRGKLIWDPRPVLEHGIRGWEASDQQRLLTSGSSFWPGIPLGPDEPAEPYPFEFDVDDRLPAVQEFYLSNPGTTD